MYWHLRILMILSESLVKAKHKGMFERECPENPGNTIHVQCIGTAV